MAPPPSISLVIEGPDAALAARDLFGCGWFEGEWSEQRGVASPRVTGQVMALANGSVTTADNVLAWWAHWRRARGVDAAPLRVVLESGGSMVALEDATRDALVDMLRTLHAARRH